MEQVMKMEGAADMKTEELRKIWKAEEALAHIHGWDFSHIDSRYREEGSLPWDYRKIILSHLGDRDYLLDMDTGRGEFLLSLGHPYSRTSAAEATLSMWSCVQRFWCRWELISERRRAICRCLFRG